MGDENDQGETTRRGVTKNEVGRRRGVLTRTPAGSRRVPSSISPSVARRWFGSRPVNFATRG
jgi:hypothetical protein